MQLPMQPSMKMLLLFVRQAITTTKILFTRLLTNMLFQLQRLQAPMQNPASPTMALQLTFALPAPEFTAPIITTPIIFLTERQWHHLLLQEQLLLLNLSFLLTTPYRLAKNFASPAITFTELPEMRFTRTSSEEEE